jgi:glycopeptide antibiotics resistance protein
MKNDLDKNFGCRSGLREDHKMIRWLRRITLMYWIALTYLLLAPDPLWFLSMPDGIDDPYSLSFPDLVQHFLALGLLGVLLTCQMNRNSMASLSFGIAIAYSVGTELVQLFVPDRFASVLDVLANLSGLAIGWVIVQYFRGMTFSRRARTSNAISS